MGPGKDTPGAGNLSGICLVYQQQNSFTIYKSTMNFIILDIEATCWQGNAMNRRQEIIELAAYSVNGYREWNDKFQRFIKPKDNPRLSAYCMELTGITQDQVNKAKRFESVFTDFQECME